MSLPSSPSPRSQTPRLQPTLGAARALALALSLVGSLPLSALSQDAANAANAPVASPPSPAASESNSSPIASDLPQPPPPARLSDATVIVVVGAPGEPEFVSAFADQAQHWSRACQRAGCRLELLGFPPRSPAVANPSADTVNATDDAGARAALAAITASPETPADASAPSADPEVRRKLQALLEKEPTQGLAPLWIVFIGHGTFDGKEARFNVEGDDISASDLVAWLKPIHRPVAVINTTSASAPFLARLSATNRVVITATRSGYEENFTRFGGYFAVALTDPSADLDADGQVSLLEAYLRAAYGVADFYKTEGRLATEHPLLDDNGDALGTPPDWFRGVRATKKPKDKAAVDGLRAHQFHLIPSPSEMALSPEIRARRDQVEREIAALRDRKANLSEDAYYQALEVLLLDLAKLYFPQIPDSSESESAPSPVSETPTP